MRNTTLIRQRGFLADDTKGDRYEDWPAGNQKRHLTWSLKTKYERMIVTNT